MIDSHRQRAYTHPEFTNTATIKRTRSKNDCSLSDFAPPLSFYFFFFFRERLETACLVTNIMRLYLHAMLNVCKCLTSRSNTFETKLFSKDNIVVARNICGFFEI